MFVKISHSLTGSLIIFDCTLLATLSVHISVSLVWQMRPIVDFPFLHVTRVQDNTVGFQNDCKKKREQWQAWANNLSMIKAAEWKRTLCTMIGEGQEEGTVVKQITSTQSFSDTAVHGMEWGCSYMPLIITTILMSSNGFAARTRAATLQQAGTWEL